MPEPKRPTMIVRKNGEVHVSGLLVVGDTEPLTDSPLQETVCTLKRQHIAEFESELTDQGPTTAARHSPLNDPLHVEECRKWLDEPTQRSLKRHLAWQACMEKLPHITAREFGVAFTDVRKTKRGAPRKKGAR